MHYPDAVVAALAITFVASQLSAQDRPQTPDEQLIWNLVEDEKLGEMPHTDDAIFASDLTPRPIIAGQRQVTDASTRKADSLASRRTNSVIHVHPQRVEVARSGDLAYSYSNFEMEYEQPGKGGRLEQVGFRGSSLNVWKKVNGKWLVVASFNRRNE
jgi:hypothetical protein